MLNPDEPVVSTQTNYSEHKTEPDSIDEAQLKLNYDDPFLKGSSYTRRKYTVQKKKEPQKTQQVNHQRNLNPPKVKFNWPDIVFVGKMENRSDNRTQVLLTIGEKQNIYSIGDSLTAGIYIDELHQDTLVLKRSSGGESKTLVINSR